ncbi:MAG: carboxypeptidase regulatory-like domain-containing protein [bacterium]|nr:carboxypeptidase regulatory-like domain-containing protein [bacterium]
MRQRRPFSEFLLAASMLILPSVVAGQGPRTISIDIESAGAATAISGRLRAQPICPRATQKCLPVFRELEGTVLGTHSLDLDPKTTWILSLEVDGYWAPEFTIAEGGRDAIAVTLIETATIVGRVRLVGEAVERPDRIRVRFTPSSDHSMTATAVVSPKENQPGSSPRGTLECPLLEQRFECTLPAVDLDLRLEVDGYAPHYLWDQSFEAGKTHSLGPFDLFAGASLIGVVDAEDPNRIEDAVIVEMMPRLMTPTADPAMIARDRTRVTAAAVGESGFFQIRGLAPGEYSLTATLAGVGSAYLPVVTITEGREHELDEPLLLRPSTRIEVFITPPLDPYDLPWNIEILKASTISRGVRERADSGMASLSGSWVSGDLPPGNYSLKLRDDRASKWVNQEIEVEPEMPPIFLAVPYISVEGTVIVGEEPVRADIWFGGRHAEHSVHLESNEDGEFSGHLSHGGRWPVDVRFHEAYTVTLKTVDVEPQPGKDVAIVELSLPDTILTGEVVDEEGRPVPRSAIFVKGKDSGEENQGTQTAADDSGVFTIRGLSAGLLEIHARDQLLDRRSEKILYTLREESEDPPLRLVIGEEITLSGYFYHTGQKIFDGLILAVTAGVHGTSSSVRQGRIEFSSGRYSVNLPKRPASVFAVAPGYAAKIFRFVPTSAGDHNLNLEMHPMGGRLGVKIPPTALAKPEIVRQVHVFHEDAFIKLGILIVNLRAEFQQDYGLLALYPLEAGHYALCLEDDCVGGDVPAGGELVLSLGSLKKLNSSEISDDERN